MSVDGHLYPVDICNCCIDISVYFVNLSKCGLGGFLDQEWYQREIGSVESCQQNQTTVRSALHHYH